MKSFTLTEEQDEVLEKWKQNHLKQHPVIRHFHEVNKVDNFVYSFQFSNNTNFKCTCVYCHHRALDYVCARSDIFNSLLYDKYMDEHDGYKLIKGEVDENGED